MVAFSLQSCFVAKNYQRPEMDETNSLYRTDRLDADSTSIASVSWKTLFTDPDLQSYIQTGLENNLDIRIALQQMAAAQAYAKQGKAGYLPTLSATAQYTGQDQSSNSQFGSFFSGVIEQYELSANLSWEADVWGKIRSNKRATEATYLQSVAAHQAVKTRLISQIASTYYQLVALDAQLKVTEQTIETREKSVETIKALKEAGNVTQVAVDQTAAQLYNAESLLVDLKAAIFRTENTLSILLGQTPHAINRGTLDGQEIQTELKVGVPALLLRNRPDVIAAEYGLINNFELTNVARSNFYPSFRLTATGGFQSLNFDNWLDSSSLFRNIIASATQPIFNQRRIRTQLEVAKAQQEQAYLTYKKTLLTAGQEVSEALYTYDAETEKYAYRMKEVEVLRNAETNSEELLNNGYANYLDLLTARQSVLNAELNVIDSKLQQLNSIITLYRSLGGGWQ